MSGDVEPIGHRNIDTISAGDLRDRRTFGGRSMPGFATLRLSWEPRILSVLRIMVRLLFLEHGLAKILDFPHPPNHAPYALFTFEPGPSRFIGVGRLSPARAGFVHPLRSLCPRGRHGGRLFHGALTQGLLSAAQRRGVGNRLLLRLPRFLACRGRRIEPRSATCARLRICPVAEPGLSIIGQRGSTERGGPFHPRSGIGMTAAEGTTGPWSPRHQ